MGTTIGSHHSPQMSDRTFPRSVLIVDDQPDIALSTEIMLIEIGVENVATASSVSEALDKIDGTAFDLALLDYDLGTHTGWRVAQRLCEDGVRMIVTTDQGGVQLPPACGDAAVLTRPYNLNVLAALVAKDPQ